MNAWLTAIILLFNEPIENPDLIVPIMDEIQAMREIFSSEVAAGQPEAEYIETVRDDVIARIAGAAIFFEDGQYFVYVDRKPERQNILVGFWDGSKKEIAIIGWDKVSTGDPKHGRDYHLTPTGIFANTTANVGYRALGTKNSKGWRGLGAKGSRVWDFGWQKTTKPRQGKEEARTIRLLMHATDPDFGEQRLGRPDSKGCVRITAKLNYFLDHYGILDCAYEQAIANGATNWLLKKDREVVKTPGRFMIIGDSTIAVAEETPTPR